MSDYRYYYFANLDEAHKFADILEKYVGKPVGELDEVCDRMYLNDPVSDYEARGSICVRLEITGGNIGAVDFSWWNPDTSSLSSLTLGSSFIFRAKRMRKRG